MEPINRLEHALNHCNQTEQERATKAASVYFMQAGEFVKVGVAIDIKTRMAMLQIGCPYSIKLLHCFQSEDAYADESSIHGELARYHFRGEWFMLPQAVIELIQSGFLYKSGPRRT